MDKEKEFYDRLCGAIPKCRECFCNDLCIYLLLKTGVATTCTDFQRRVRKVIDRENRKLRENNEKKE